MIWSKSQIFEELLKSAKTVRESESVLKTNQSLTDFSNSVDQFCGLFFGGKSFKQSSAIKRIRGEDVARDRCAKNRPRAIKAEQENLDALTYIRKSGFIV